MDPLCWSCEYVHYEANRAEPQCRKRWLRLTTLPTAAEGCADFAPRKWGTVYCPRCLGTGAPATLHVENGKGAYSAVCTHNPTHRWPLLPPHGNRERCPACGSFFLTFDYTPQVPTAVGHYILYALCPHCSVGQVTTPKRGRGRPRPLHPSIRTV